MSAARKPEPPHEHAPPLTDYRCRECGTWLLASDATHGRLRVRCPNRRCGRVQLLFLGGFQPKRHDDEDEGE